jgi:hypothetical protein
MTKLNYDEMTEAELRAYVISHQDDQEAFYAFVDRLQAKPGRVVYPASMTPEEIQKVILERIQQKQKLSDSETPA